MHGTISIRSVITSQNVNKNRASDWLCHKALVLLWMHFLLSDHIEIHTYLVCVAQTKHFKPIPFTCRDYNIVLNHSIFEHYFTRYLPHPLNKIKRHDLNIILTALPSTCSCLITPSHLVVLSYVTLSESKTADGIRSIAWMDLIQSTESIESLLPLWLLLREGVDLLVAKACRVGITLRQGRFFAVNIEHHVPRIQQSTLWKLKHGACWLANTHKQLTTKLKVTTKR